MSGSPEGNSPRPAWRPHGLARRSYRLPVTVAAGSSLQLTVRYRGRRYRAEISDSGTGRRWRCPHGHLTRASARQCAGVMTRRIARIGWQRATGRHRAPQQ